MTWTCAACVIVVSMCLTVPGSAFADNATGSMATDAEKARAEHWLANHFKSAPAFSFLIGDQTSRSLKWDAAYSDQAAGAGVARHTGVFSSAGTPVRVTYTATHYTELAAIELLLELENTGTADTPILDAIRCLDVLFPELSGSCAVRHPLGEDNSGKSFRPVENMLNADTKDPLVLFPTQGRSTDGHMPYFTLAGEQGGIVLAIGWAGRWQTAFTRQDDGVRAECGLHDARFKLLPGERVRMPRVLIQFWDGKDPQRGSNLFRQWMLRHSLPRRGGELVMPPICGSVTRVEPDGSYEKPHLDAIAALSAQGIKTFWSDMDPQQWYPKGFPQGTGTWEVDTTKYPNGLKPIGDAAHAAGMKYLLWFEPERVAPDTRIMEVHPEWVTNGLFALHIPEARVWITDYIDQQITAGGVDWLRWDFNMNPWDSWKANDAPDRRGITEIRHVEGLYAMWEDLFQRHPGLVVDVCSSGGRRLDFETLRYGLPLWHSDMQCFGPNPPSDQLQNGGLFQWIPLHGCGNFDYEPSYKFRSAMTPGNLLVRAIAYANGDDANDAAREGIRKTLAIYEKLRPFMIGDFYPLFVHEEGEDRWYGYQFHRPDLDAGYALLFRRGASPYPTAEIALQGLKTDRQYDVTYEDKSDHSVVAGDALTHFPCTIETAPGSAIVYYHPVK